MDALQEQGLLDRLVREDIHTRGHRRKHPKAHRCEDVVCGYYVSQFPCAHRLDAVTTLCGLVYTVCTIYTYLYRYIYFHQMLYVALWPTYLRTGFHHLSPARALLRYLCYPRKRALEKRQNFSEFCVFYQRSNSEEVKQMPAILCGGNLLWHFAIFLNQAQSTSMNSYIKGHPYVWCWCYLRDAEM